MLSTIGDWYRLVTPFPDDERLRKRRLSAGRLATNLAKAKPDELLDIVGLAIESVGQERNPNNPALGTVLESMLEDEPSIDRQNEALTLDPRICAAVAVSEFMNNATAPRRQTSAALAAGAVVSGLRYRHVAAGEYAAQRAGALLALAESVLDSIDTRRRERKDTAVTRFEKTVQSDTVDVVAAVKALVAGLNEEMLKDREELQALWWVFGGYSHRARKSFKQLDRGEAALLSGVELGEIVSPPATFGFSALSVRMARAAQGADEVVPLRDLLQPISVDTWSILRPALQDVERVQRNPILFPVTAVAVRIQRGLDLDRALREPGSLGMDTGMAAVDIAAQVFAEQALIAAANGA